MICSHISGLIEKDRGYGYIPNACEGPENPRVGGSIMSLHNSRDAIRVKTKWLNFTEKSSFTYETDENIETPAF